VSVFPVRASGDENVLKHNFPTKQADIAADLRKQMTSECDVVDYDDIHSVLLKQEIDKKGVLIYDGQNL